MKTQRMQVNSNKVAQINDIKAVNVFNWLKNGVGDFIHCPGLATFYGFLFWAVSFGIWELLTAQESLRDVSAPLLAVIILVLGPISAMSLYSASKKISAGEEISISSINKVVGAAFKVKGSCPSIFLSLILLLLAIAWMMFTPLIYAIFSDSLFISEGKNIAQSIAHDIMNGNNVNFIIAYGIFTAGFAWLAFMISWFSFPMVLDKDVDPFTAAISSIRLSIVNKWTMVLWVPIIGVLVVGALLTPYFVGLIIVIPVLAHSTWHAYKSMVGEMQEKTI